MGTSRSSVQQSTHPFFSTSLPISVVNISSPPDLWIHVQALPS